jgi:hypothetical protein
LRQDKGEKGENKEVKSNRKKVYRKYDGENRDVPVNGRK